MEISVVRKRIDWEFLIMSAAKLVRCPWNFEFRHCASATQKVLNVLNCWISCVEFIRGKKLNRLRSFTFILHQPSDDIERNSTKIIKQFKSQSELFNWSDTHTLHTHTRRKSLISIWISSSVYVNQVRWTKFVFKTFKIVIMYFYGVVIPTHRIGNIKNQFLFFRCLFFHDTNRFGNLRVYNADIFNFDYITILK